MGKDVSMWSILTHNQLDLNAYTTKVIEVEYENWNIWWEFGESEANQCTTIETSKNENWLQENTSFAV